MENAIADYIVPVIMFAGGGAVVWYFWPRIKAWWGSK